MKPILETPRFILKEFSEEDAVGFYQMNLDKEVMKFTGDQPFESVEKAKQFIKSYDHYKKYGFGRWTIIEKGTNNYIGWCGLKMTESINEVDIGFRIKKEYWNKGIATETSEAVLKYGFERLKLKNIAARALKDNPASIKVIKKLGMKYRNNFKDENGEWVVYEVSN